MDKRFKSLFFYGCMQKHAQGHYLWETETSNIDSLNNESTIRLLMPGINTNVIERIDMLFTPPQILVPEGVYNECIVPPMLIIAWWDFSVDKMGDSNSAFIGYRYNSAEEILFDAAKLFPSVLARQRKPLTKWNQA